MRLQKCVFLFLLVFLGLNYPNTTTAQITCTANGNLFVYTNYDGGVLNLNVDVNIPNLKIGVCTYEPVTINLTGPFVNNVTEVRYAGYVSTNNNHCSNSPTTTTIVGAPAGATTSVLFLPASTLSNPNGNGSVVCAYSCTTTSSQGGCNTADQIKDYFQTSMNATLVSYFTQYGCWSITPYDLSAGGNCCNSVNACTITANAGSDVAICPGAQTPLNGSGTGSITTYSWSPTTGLSNPNSASPTASPTATTTYILTTSDGATCFATDTVTVTIQTPQVTFPTPSPVCENQAPVTLSGGSPGGGTYMGPGVTGGVFDPGIGEGSYPVTYTATDNNGCTATDTAVQQVFGVPNAAIDPLPGFCEGDAATQLLGSPAGGTFSGSGVSNGGFDPVAAGLGTHLISYIYADTNGCSDTATANAVVSATPATPLIVAIGMDSLNAGMPGDSFHWIRDGVLQAALDQQILGIPTATYQVVAWVNGCPSDTSEGYFLEAMSRTEGLNGLFRIYPNPTHNLLILETELAHYSYTLRDVNGSLKQTDTSVAGLTRIDLSQLPAGFYLLQIESDDRTLHQKVLKIR